MGRFYIVPFENVAIAAAQDIFSCAPATNKPTVCHGFEVSNVGGSADAGDAQEELLRLSVKRGNTVQGSGGSSPTAEPLLGADTAIGATIHVNDTTTANTGTAHLLGSFGWNIRIPEPKLFQPERRVLCTAAQTLFVVRLEAAPNDSVNCSGEMLLEEVA